jgi:hypothetical protein
MFGGLGLLLFWFEPFGHILGTVGILLALAGLAANYTQGGRPWRQAVGGLIVSAGALVISVATSLAVTGHVLGSSGGWAW